MSLRNVLSVPSDASSISARCRHTDGASLFLRTPGKDRQRNDMICLLFVPQEEMRNHLLEKATEQSYGSDRTHRDNYVTLKR